MLNVLLSRFSAYKHLSFISLSLIIPTNNPTLYLHPLSLSFSLFQQTIQHFVTLILSDPFDLSLVLHGHFAEQILHLTPPCLSHSQLVDRHRVVIHVQLKHAIAHRFVRLIMELREILVIQRLFHRDSLLRIDHQHATQ